MMIWICRIPRAASFSRKLIADGRRHDLWFVNERSPVIQVARSLDCNRTCMNCMKKLPYLRVRFQASFRDCLYVMLFGHVCHDPSSACHRMSWTYEFQKSNHNLSPTNQNIQYINRLSDSRLRSKMYVERSDFSFHLVPRNLAKQLVSLL